MYSELSGRRGVIVHIVHTRCDSDDVGGASDLLQLVGWLDSIGLLDLRIDSSCQSCLIINQLDS